MIEHTRAFLDKKIDDINELDIQTLREVIKYHSDLYHNKEAPIISDTEYDILFKLLQQAEKKFGAEQTSLEVGAELKESSFAKVAHSRPMISLDNTYNADELRDFDNRVKKLMNPPQSPLVRGEGYNEISSTLSNKDRVIEYTMEFKFDGLGIELIYENGNLIQAITRGNGLVGEDVTQNILQIDNIPKKIQIQERIEIRGEVVMPLSSFEMLNEQAKREATKIFSNPRNAASGSVRMKDNRVTKGRKLQFFAYDVGDWESIQNFSQTQPSPPAPLPRGEGSSQRSYYDFIYWLEGLGFEISSYFKKCSGIEEIIQNIEEIGDIKKKIDFEIDGLVIKVENIDLWKDIGSTEHHPRYAISYKFPAELFTTEILSVEHQVGRTGTITPVANLEPVNINGAIIRRATLHNYEEVEKLSVGVGDRVFLKRAGEVIPKIVSVALHANKGTILPPHKCPSCHTEVQKDEDKVRYYCPNTLDCPAQHSEKLIFAVGKQGFDIDGFGEKQVELFLREGIISNIGDIFRIADKKDVILDLDGFQEKSVENLIAGVEKAKHIDIATLLCALGIPGVGKKTAKTLSRLFFSHDNLLNFSYTEEEMESLSDIGPEIAKNIIEYFTDTHHKEILEELSDILEITYYQEKAEGGIWNGVKICITGSFEGYSRDDLIKILEENGGEFVSSVSKKTDYLLAGEKAGSKLKKAQDNGVEVINLEEFLEKTKA
ncbi:NAD-dependent DNA ligase LigA [Candidatus Gracilibacteria bacterium]|nr:NAD-dependent DNA ligase LigA [Candidatus Gracilibacteria bacterium]